MPLNRLLTSQVLDAHYDQNNDWLYLDWKGPQKLAWVQAAGQQVLDLVRQLGIRKVLNDNTHITETSWELVEWIAYDYLPQVGQAGVEYVGWVHSPALECRGHLDLMVTFLGQKPEVSTFGDVASAYAWLSSVQVPVRQR